MRSFPLNKKHLSRILYSAIFLAGFFVSSSFSTDATYGNLTVTTAIGVGGVAPNPGAPIFLPHPTTYGPGYCDIYAYRNGGSFSDSGTSWDINGVESGIKAYSFNGEKYSAAIVAYNFIGPNCPSGRSPSCALVASADRSGSNHAAYLSYCDPLSANGIYSAYFTSNILMGPPTGGQRWIIYQTSNGNYFTIAPDSATNFAWGKNFTINRTNGQVGIGVSPSNTSTNKLEVGGNTQLDGKLGVGTAPGSNQLAVQGNAAIKGTLFANAITVTASISPWPDFVFNKKYKSRPLAETESYIRKNGHLPGMPSQKDVSKNGINVGEMQAKMLKTMEEMTLQMIEMKKENSMLAAKNDELAAKIEKIERNAK